MTDQENQRYFVDNVRESVINFVQICLAFGSGTSKDAIYLSNAIMHLFLGLNLPV